jgi:SM-20-related protein
MISPSRFKLSDAQVHALGEGRALEFDDLLGKTAALALSEELRGERFRLEPAGMGSGPVRHRDALHRGDEITWLERQQSGPILALLCRCFDQLGEDLRRCAYLDLRGFDLQLARYRGDGVRYVRHRDAFSVHPRRRVTAIYYLNPGWRSEHGGELRVYESGVAPREVAPLLDRCVVFLSERLEHEVRPCFAERFALTAWFAGADCPL